MTASKGNAPGNGLIATATSFRWRTDPSSHDELLFEHLAKQLFISEPDASDLIDFGSIHINGRAVRNPSWRLSGNEEVWVYLPLHGTRRAYEINPDRILYRDACLLAYNKEAGIPSQQTPADAYNNLYAAVYRHLSKDSPSPYVALHHRLDQETSGVMLFAVDRTVNRSLGNAFQKHNVGKDYLAWVEGVPSKDEWICKKAIGRKGGRYLIRSSDKGKTAETWFKVIFSDGDSLVLARPLTGRTHQIRLHLAADGHPVMGDRLYGGRRAKRLLLHAYRLRLWHPTTKGELRITAPIPEDWPLPQSVDFG